MTHIFKSGDTSLLLIFFVLRKKYGLQNFGKLLDKKKTVLSWDRLVMLCKLE